MRKKFYKFKQKFLVDMSGLGPSDLVLSSYPKSGNTWVRYMLVYLSLYLSGHKEQVVNAFNISTFSPELPGRIGTNYTTSVFPRVVKTHMPYLTSFSKVLFLVRDPASVIRSYYLYAKARRIIEDNITTWQFLKDDRLGVEGWKRHTISYLNASSKGFGVQIVNYEAIKEDPEGFLRHIARLFGISVGTELIGDVIKSTTLGALKNEEQYLLKGTCGDGGFEFFGGTEKSKFNLDLEHLDYIERETEEVRSKLKSICVW